MKTVNFLEGASGSGLYFITSGEVQRAIGKQNPFEQVVNPAERIRKMDRLSKTIEKQVNVNIRKKVQKLRPAVGRKK
jgi:hypothetical protein